VAKLEESVDDGGQTYALSTNHWIDGTVAPGIWRSRAVPARRHHAGGTYACADALLEKRV
jgi:hypothetical protein